MSETSITSEREKELKAMQYRFSGYQLPMIQLDETGPSYVVLKPHPYYSHQPAYWTKPIQYIGQQLPPEQVPISDTKQKNAVNAKTVNKTLYGLLPFKK